MNTVILSGRIINDVEVRQSTGNNGTFITARTSIAVRRPGSRRDKDTGYYPSDLINIEASGTAGEVLSNVKKGEIISAQGYYRIDEYDDRNGQKHYAHKIRVNIVERESANIPRNNSQNQQTMQQQNNQNYNNGNIALPQQNMRQQMQQPMNQPVSQSAAPQQQTMQQTIPNGTYDIPQGMPQGQGMPDFSNLEGMPNFENLPFV